MQDNIIVFPEPPPGHTAQFVTRAFPVSLTSLIGREHEMQAIHALLLRPDVRLLTITGTAGVGKTRLALEVARNLVPDFADGVHVVSLAPLSDPAFVIPTIAHSMGLTESGLQPLFDVLFSNASQGYFFDYKLVKIWLDKIKSTRAIDIFRRTGDKGAVWKHWSLDSVFRM
jgi:hypothetical protein